ncbi:MAG TPA: hypothetical protein VFT30_11130, partial [Nitrospira sp.]|nr:hypothetical protein [Nitrospira sp.]
SVSKEKPQSKASSDRNRAFFIFPPKNKLTLKGQSEGTVGKKLQKNGYISETLFVLCVRDVAKI